MKRKCTNANCSNYHKELAESKVICPSCGSITDILETTEPKQITESFRSDSNLVIENSTKRKCTNANCFNCDQPLPPSNVRCSRCGTFTENYQTRKPKKTTESFQPYFNLLNNIYDYLLQLIPDNSIYLFKLFIFVLLVSFVLIPIHPIFLFICILTQGLLLILLIPFILCITLNILIVIGHIITMPILIISNISNAIQVLITLKFSDLLDTILLKKNSFNKNKILFILAVILTLMQILTFLVSEGIYTLPGQESSPSSSKVPLSKEISPGSGISEAIKKEIQNQLPGQLLINLPSEMTVGIQERVEIRISEQGIKNFQEGLRVKGIPKIEEIKISPIMEARLIGDEFYLQELSHKVQPITDSEFTQWEWNVTPKLAGNQSLLISVSVRIEIPQGGEQIVKSYPVYEKKIKVKINQLEKVKILIFFVTIFYGSFIFITNKKYLTAWFKRQKLDNLSTQLDQIQSPVLKSVLIGLENGNFEMGFPAITVQIFTGNNPRPTQFSGELPPIPEIIQMYNNWQLMYNNANQGIKRKLDEKSGRVTNASYQDLNDLSQQLEKKLNQWLISEQFIPIDRILRQNFNPGDELQIIIQSQNPDVRKLPWHLWDFFKPYRYAEIALSAPFYDRVEKIANPRNEIRILSILGDSKDIDTNPDREIISTLVPKAEFLDKPNPQELDTQLWSEQGWDILCFSGHSSSTMDGSEGYICINDTDKLTIPHLKNALSTAIARGLQIAIFNSCDGLGLARQLAELHIPQIIVFREPVPDRVAQEFLKNFLTAFAGGKSFYLAVREAREKLQPLEQYFPCATWLPVICQNPAEVPPTWRSLQHP